MVKTMFMKFILSLFLIFCTGSLWSIEIKNVGVLNLRTDKVYSSSTNGFYLFSDNSLYFLNLDRFDKLVDYDSSFDNIIANEKYFVIYSLKKIEVFDKEKKKLLWAKNIKGQIDSNVLISSTCLFFSKSFGVILAFDIENGNLLWKFKLEMDPIVYATNSKMLQTNKYLIYIYSDKRVYILLKKNGRKIKASNIENPFISGNVNLYSSILAARVYNSTLYILYDSGYFVEYNIPRRSILFAADNFRYRDFYVFGDKLFFLSEDASIIAMNKISKKICWKNLSYINSLSNKMYFLPEKKMFLIYNNSEFIHTVDIDYGFSTSIIKSENKIKDIGYDGDNLLVLFFNNKNILYDIF